MQDGSIPKHKILVDGLANELQVVAVNVILLINCMEEEVSTCNFP